jgi:leucyl aminopeptidase
MAFSLSLKATDRPDADLVAIALGTTPDLAALKALDKATGGVIGHAVETRTFRGGRDEVLHLTAGKRGERRLVLIGMGGTPTHGSVRRAAALAARTAKKLGAPSLAFWAPGRDADADVESAAAGLHLGAWDYLEVKSPPKPEDKRPSLEKGVLVVADAKASKRAFDVGDALGVGQSLGRRLQMMPGNLCTPQYLADTAREIAKRHGGKVTVLGRKEMEKRGMGSFLCVAQGTTQEPQLITIEYRKGPKGAKPIALVGKGLCFDSGGISIKPAAGMEWMKFDMSGAAGVLGAMEAIGRLGLAVNVVALIGATTNMPSGEAVKPGDVVRASNGKYIEIINTDAEGRLVLADVLVHAGTFDPAVIVDAATLTGACVIALGNTTVGLMTNDEALTEEVRAAASRASEPAWPLPMTPDYKELIVSDVADIKNSGGRAAGTITAAKFLEEFVPEGVPWAHLDVAGTAYSESDLTFIPKGPTGTPVGTFFHFVRGRAS